MNCYKCATPLPDHSKFCMACGADVSGEGHTHQTVNMEPDPELLAALQAELGSEFVVERELGRGGMAIVYLGQDTHLGRKVAIKLLPPMLTFGSGPAFIERFKREARTAATLDHPHIIPVYRVSSGGKLFWYVMKYLQGESLDVLMKREGALGVDRTVEILAQAADALDYAHQNGVVHRDIKPANIMIDKRGRVTVTDFGIAKALDNSGLTGSGATIGTPHYMSPEQCNGIGVSGASDQYSLAITAYQMLSGDLPFSADSILELMRMHLMDPPPPLATLCPQLPPGVIAAVERGLAKTTGERFPTCVEFVNTLKVASQEAEKAGRRPTVAAAPATLTVPRVIAKVREDVAPPAVLAKTQLEAPRPRPVMSRPKLRAGIGIGAVAAAIAIGMVISKGDPPVAADTTNPQSAVLSQSGTRSAADTPSTTAATSRGATTAAAPPAEPTAPRPSVPPTGQIALQRVPRGAVVVRDGQRVTGTTFEVPAGRPTTVEVRAEGFTTWRRTFTPDSGQRLAPSVVLERIAAANTAPPAAAPVAGIAYVTVGSRPVSSITINGRPAPANPVLNFEVPSGRVVVRFQVTDSTGVWSVDTTVTLAPGERRNLGRIQLKRP